MIRCHQRPVRFRADGDEIEHAYELDVRLTTVFYVVMGNDVMVQTVVWRDI